MPRFFVSPDSIIEGAEGPHVLIEGDDAHHIVRVLRLRSGDRLWIADGTGLEYEGAISELDRTQVKVMLSTPQVAKGEPAQRITLFQGLPKSDKMDWIVQKAAEIGMSDVVPVAMERSVSSLTAAKAVGRISRWQRIAESAAQQAARGRVPQVHELATISDALRAWRENNPDGLMLVPWEQEEALGIRSLLRSVQPVPHEIAIVIGPEGGMTEDEIAISSELGGRACTLGPRILRTETAGTVVAALILYELGDMGG